MLTTGSVMLTTESVMLTTENVPLTTDIVLAVRGAGSVVSITAYSVDRISPAPILPATIPIQSG